MVATVAASVAVGVGISIARLAREWHTKHDRRLGLLTGESPLSGLQRMALGQLDIALETLAGGKPAPDESAVHETRKALKRLRALLRLLAATLGEDEYERESAALRDAGRRLAGARDAEVMLATLDGLVARHRRELAGRGSVIGLRAALQTERERVRRQTLGDPRELAGAVAELQACRARVAAWKLPQRSGLDAVEPGLLHLYRQGRSRLKRAARANSTDMIAMHEWRKRVKDLRYVAEMLEPLQSSGRAGGKSAQGKRARRRRAQARKHAARLHRVARRSDRLGEMLGEDHDLAVLARRIERESETSGNQSPRVGHGTRKRLLKLIAKRRRRLRRKALREGERLYGPSPKKLTHTIRGAHQRR